MKTKFIQRLNFNSNMLSIQIASNYEKAEILSATLLKSDPIIIGFDTETSIWRNVDPYYTSTLQLSTDNICYIFQLYRIFKEYGKLPREISKILENPNIIKIGVDLTNDIRGLACYGITLRGTIDIQCIARTMMISDVSLKGLITQFFPEELGKEMLNLMWEWDGDLSKEQICYAAKDAYFSLKIYQKMLNGENVIKISTDIPIYDSEEETEKYLEWLKKMPKSTPIKIEKLVNQTVNSYGPWVKQYSKTERASLAEKLINKFVEGNLL